MQRNAGGQSVSIFAYNPFSLGPQTDDAANITVYVQADDGVPTVVSANSGHPTETSSTHAPGDYKIALSQAETNVSKLRVSAISTTSGVIIEPFTIYTTMPLTVAPTQAATVPSGAAAGPALAVYQKALSPTFIIPVVDAAKNPVNLTGRLVNFVVYDRYGVQVFEQTGLSVTGASNNLVNLQVVPANVPTVGQFRYQIWDNTDNANPMLLAESDFNVLYSQIVPPNPTLSYKWYSDGAVGSISGAVNFGGVPLPSYANGVAAWHINIKDSSGTDRSSIIAEWRAGKQITVTDGATTYSLTITASGTRLNDNLGLEHPDYYNFPGTVVVANPSDGVIGSGGGTPVTITY